VHRLSVAVSRVAVSRVAACDLGAVAAPVLVFGGPYSNLEASAAMLDEARRLGIPPERTLCTGDVVAYCADPEPTARRIEDSGVQVVMGNCEESLGAGALDCACGFRPGGGCDLLAVQWYDYATRHLSPECRAWMARLPRAIRFTLNGVRLVAVHGSVSSINRYVFASTPEEDKRAEIALADADGVIGGHCGIPFTQVLGDRLWHNAGAIGMPANDGTPRVWYSLIAPGEAGEGIAISHHALAYDHERAAAKMIERGLPEGYARALGTGRWPSLDVLRPEEQAATGQALRIDGARVRFAPNAQPRTDEPARMRLRNAV